MLDRVLCVWHVLCMGRVRVHVAHSLVQYPWDFRMPNFKCVCIRYSQIFFLFLFRSGAHTYIVHTGSFTPSLTHSIAQVFLFYIINISRMHFMHICLSI